MSRPRYDKRPVAFVGDSAACTVGWTGIAEELKRACRSLDERRAVLCVECYPGVRSDDVIEALEPLLPASAFFQSEACFVSAERAEQTLAPYLSDDPVFGYLCPLTFDDLLDRERKEELAAEIAGAPEGLVVVVGVAASRLCDFDVLVYADLSRWEIQARQRRGEVGNLFVHNESARPAEKYKRGYFVDWRLADRDKNDLLRRADFLLDTHVAQAPKLVVGDALRSALASISTRPFRVAPFFDPGPWGGQWMRRTCELPEGPPNYAWCFDCVPEENSLLLRFGDVDVEIAALDLVFLEPRRLLGSEIVEVLGAEFPIRFDFLDTMEGGNLSLQVHPSREYIREHFGMSYTQDESYYLLDAGDDAGVYLGVREGVSPREMADALSTANRGGAPFDADAFVNRLPAKKHDHFLIPAGTVHASGNNAMVLEISATPYIFTFKLWDWGRLGLDGRPRPIHLEHGLANLRFERDSAFVKAHLVNAITPLGEGAGWRAERTGLHEEEPLETHRHWFTTTIEHDTADTVNVLNLVEGDAVVVESPTGAFAPFEVRYAETFIVPASVGRYTVRPLDEKKEHATLKAFLRPGALRARMTTSSPR